MNYLRKLFAKKQGLFVDKSPIYTHPIKNKFFGFLNP